MADISYEYKIVNLLKHFEIFFLCNSIVNFSAMNFIDDNVISKCQLISEPQPKVSPTPAHICLVISMSFQLYISMKGGHKWKYTAYTFSKTLERCTETTLSKNKHFSVDLEHAGLYAGFCLTEQTRWLLFECTTST